ncbi:Ubiquitin carboxyl-terminal hydrolase 32 [Acropora cervicornis]|uniref:Ubiquitin carboxyl-terminal hydrolase 32 n=1 Tax=Acropora cervicornis TaxID=6130 RepID=A0AAD9VH89_ACRCE|nr:Ubiquitin carboxyl-terminal hydrolase 32 [Acropora cervicornis]
MGLRESKLSFLSYEEATKRVTDDEMQRLRLAFKRCTGASGFMPQPAFSREVLGDGVPSKVAEHIYAAFGGTNKGITFRDLLCGLVLLTRGTREEKIKFIFNIYSTDGAFVNKDNMESLILGCDGGNIPQPVIDCFSENDRLTFEEFSNWLIKNPDVTTLTRWLLFVSNGCSMQLTDNSETPTFYQTLASVTHWLFSAFDENQDGHIDFRELACGISKCCRGPNSERQKFYFRVFDSDGDGFLTRSDIEVMCKALIEIRKENIGEKDASVIWDKDLCLVAAEVLSDCRKDEDGQISLEEYKEWAASRSFSQWFPKLGWLEREYQHDLKANTIWYLPYIRRSSTGTMTENGTLPNRLNEGHKMPGNPGQAWGNKSSQKPFTLPRRTSQPAFNHGQMAVSPSGAMNGHCVQGTVCGTQVPGPIDNVPLVETETRKVMVLTGEGGKLKRNIPLCRGRDFEIIPEPVWRALQQWYGGGPALPRTVISPTNGDPNPELELYPISLRLFRHSPPPTRGGITTWTGVGFGLNGFGFGGNTLTTPHAPPKRYLAYVAAFSRMNTIQQSKLRLLEEDNSTLETLEIHGNHAVLIEGW